MKSVKINFIQLNYLTLTQMFLFKKKMICKFKSIKNVTYK